MYKNKLKHMGFFKLGAMAAAIAVVSPLASADVVTNSILATGTYVLGTDPLVNVPQQNFGNSVDVIAFPGYYNGNVNNAVLHSYGSTTGNFGSRSSGYGVYDVNGSFRIEQTISNNSATAQHAFFNFFITPGQLSSDIGTALSGTEFVTSGLVFDIRRGATQVWGSSATLLTDTLGSHLTTTGDASLYNGSGAYYAINGINKSVDLGVVNAGESFILSYELDSFARGNSVAGIARVVDETSYYVPDQWVESCTGGYGDGYAASSAYGGDGNPPPPPPTPRVCTPMLLPGHTVIVPGYTVPGRASGSIAQSGDPFDIQFVNYGSPQGDVIFYGVGSSAQPANNVPEPGELALFLAALGLAGWATKRRRTANSAI